jgi:DNA recombination-dependent growth factor C
MSPLEESEGPAAHAGKGFRMGLIAGSASFARFQVTDDLPEGFLEALPEKIARCAFRPLDESSEEARSSGWVNIMDEYDSRFEGKEYLKGPFLALSYRLDVRSVPSRALVQYCRDEEERIRAEEKLEYLSRERRSEIREAVKAKLFRRAIPRSQVYDVIWSLDTGGILFGGTATKLCDEFTGFFFNCFGVHLKTVFPYSLASEVAREQALNPGILDGLRSSIFVEGE